MRMVPRCVILMLALAACAGPPRTAPAPGAAVVLPRDLAGCYALQNGAGQPASHLYYAPPKFRLNEDTVSRFVRLFSRDRAWTLTRLDADGQPIAEQHAQPVLYWMAHSASDSLDIMIHTGHSGSQLIVGGPGGVETLRGRAVQHWDTGPTRTVDGGPVVVIRIPCID